MNVLDAIDMNVLDAIETRSTIKLFAHTWLEYVNYPLTNAFDHD